MFLRAEQLNASELKNRKVVGLFKIKQKRVPRVSGFAPTLRARDSPLFRLRIQSPEWPLGVYMGELNSFQIRFYFLRHTHFLDHFFNRLMKTTDHFLTDTGRSQIILKRRAFRRSRIRIGTCWMHVALRKIRIAGSCITTFKEWGSSWIVFFF